MLYLTRNRSNGASAESGLDRLFDEMTRGFGFHPAQATSEFEPALEVTEAEGEWTVRAELPGVAIEDVEVSVTGNVLTIRGEKKAETTQEGETYRRSERRYGKFIRSLEFPADLDGRNVEARAKNGVLLVRLPKAEQARPKTIAIKTE